MAYLGNAPNLSTMRTLVEGVAYNNQIEIPVPGGFNQGMIDVVVGGADLGSADYDSSNGASIKLYVPMSVGTQFKVVAWTPNQTVVNAGGQLAGFRNRIINGDCRIQQRVPGVVTGVTGGLYGGPDRYLTSMSSTAGGQVTIAAGSIVFGGITRSAVVCTVNTAATTLTTTNFWQGIHQRIEGSNAFDLAGQPVCVSFIFNTNVSGTYSVSLIDGGGLNSYVTSFSAVANTPTKIILPIATLPANLSIPNSNAIGLYVTVGFLNTGSYQTSTQNAWQSGIFYSATGATNWATTANNFIALTELQLEPGSIATTFERRPYGLELVLCQRYYQTDAPVVIPTRVDFFSPLMYKTPMRASPSVFWISTGTQANGFIRDNDNARDVPVTGAGGTTTFCYPVTTGSPAMAVGANTTLQYRSSAEL